MLVDGYSPLWIPCEFDSSRKNVHMGWLLWRYIGNQKGSVEGQGRDVCEHEGCVGSATCLIFFFLKKKPIAHVRENPCTAETPNVRFCSENIRQVSKIQTGKNHSTVMIWVQQWKIGETQMLDCLEMQQCMTGFATTRLFCYHRMNIWELETENNLLLSLCVRGTAYVCAFNVVWRAYCGH